MDGESFFWHSEVQGSDSKKRSRNSALPVQIQDKNSKPAPKNKKSSAKFNRAETRKSTSF